jgi:hypothetical protein
MIERKRADAQLGGGQKRIDAQHKKVKGQLISPPERALSALVSDILCLGQTYST